MQLDDIIRRCVLDDSSILAVSRATGVPQATLQEFVIGKSDGTYSDLRLSSVIKLVEHYGLDKSLRPSSSRKGKRMQLATELEVCGCDDSPEKFKERLIENIMTKFPGRSIDSLVCAPTDALQYCNQIREGIGAEYLYDGVILKALMNIRKQKNCPTNLRSNEPRKFLKTRLKEIKCEIPEATFRDLMCDCFADMYKSRTIDEIVCNPKEAKALCNYARMKADHQSLSDQLVLTTIMNVRKAG